MLQIPFRAAASLPAALAVREGVEELVERPAVAIENQDVAVAVALWPAFDRRVARDRIGAGIALVGGSVKVIGTFGCDFETTT